jgi:RHS repeat-associated protein
MLRSRWLIAGLAALLACQNNSNSAPPVRLNPSFAASNGSAAALFDRDTSSARTLEGPVDVTLDFGHPIELRALKVFGGEDVDISGIGLSRGTQKAGAWTSRELSGTRNAIALHLSPRDPGATVGELEVWGYGRPEAPRDPQRLAEASKGIDELPYENAALTKVQPQSFTLQPAGIQQGGDCNSTLAVYSTFTRSVRRAYLAFEAPLPRPEGLRVSLNGHAPVGGFWLSSSAATHTLAVELDPEELTGRDLLTLCLPAEATDAVRVEGLRLILVQDDGTADFERDTQLALASAADGDETTSSNFAAGTLPISLERPSALERIRIKVDSPTASFTWMKGASGPTESARESLKKGWSELPLAASGERDWRVELEGPARKDIPAATIAELSTSGSGVGGRIGAPRIVLTSPRLRWADGQLDGERFTDRAFLSGWAESPSGTGRVEVEGALVSNGDGSFSTEVHRPYPAPEDWAVTLKATFPDGSEVEKTIHLLDDDQADIDRDAPTTVASGDDESRFGKEDEVVWGKFDPLTGAKVTLGTDVSIEAPPGAVSSATPIGLSRRSPEAVPPLDPGMVNVTAPENAGYRFTPHGQKFSKPVRVTLPYSETLLPEGLAPEDIQTFFYDEAAQHWTPLPRVQVSRATKQVQSETTHFTFMINAVLVTPDHPSPVSFNPNLMKDVKAADPSEGIDLIAPPTGNNQGTAQLSFPIRLPKARGAYQPALQLSYDSSAPNGWLGVGWTLTTSSIAIDTKFGAPRYDGSDRYLLDGAELVPVGTTDDCLDTSPGFLFAERVLRSFDRIVRCGTAASGYHFEVTDRSGTLYVYGATGGARLSEYPATAKPRTGQWFLERVVDAHGNLTEYGYDIDHNTHSTDFDLASQQDFSQVYLTSIRFSGTADRFGGSWDAGSGDDFPYEVDLVSEESRPYVAQDRSDIIVSGRMGFKTALRRRLGRILVKFKDPKLGNRTLREYALHYRTGDFGKSLVSSIEVYGEGGSSNGHLFYSHGFEYTSATPGFAGVQQWDVGDTDALTASNETAAGVRFFAGISDSPARDTGSIGFSLGFNHRQSSTSSLLLDINGDGLPDRISGVNGRFLVRLNQATPLEDTSANHSMASVAPRGDPAAGSPLSSFVAPISLGNDSEDALDFGIQGVFGPIAANVGASWDWTKSDSYMLDVDGDGLVDSVLPDLVRFNEPRTCSGEGCASSNTFEFSDLKHVETIANLATLAVLPDGGTLLVDDPDLAAARNGADQQSTPTDLLVEWRAPYDGTIDVSANLAWKNTPPPGAPHDGVNVWIYQYHPGAPAVFNDDQTFTNMVGDIGFSADTPNQPIQLSPLSVKAGDYLYFRLSTRKDFPVQMPVDSGDPGISLEEVQLAPVIRYTSCAGCAMPADGGDVLQPNGAPAFTFALNDDLRLAGGPPGAISVPKTGTIAIGGTFEKDKPTSDDVRACVQRFSLSELQDGGVPDVPCNFSNSGAVFAVTSDWTGSTNSYTPAVEVTQGDALVFRVESDLPIDPSGIRWTPNGHMTQVSDERGTRVPSDDEQKALSFTADPYVKLHWQFEGAPEQPLVIPHDGTLSYASSTQTLLDGFRGQFFAARTQDRLIFKHVAGEPTKTGTLEVHAGEAIFFERHCELATGDQGWNVQAQLTYPAADGGTETVPLSPPKNVSYEQYANLNQDTFKVEYLPKYSAFAGGYHGWRFGTWGGTDKDAFDGSLFFKDATLDFGDGDDREHYLAAKSTIRDDNSDASKHSRLFAPLVPRNDGTTVNGNPGLKPTSAFINQDGTAYLALDGTMNAGRKGGYSAVGGTGYAVVALFNIGDTARVSSTTGASGGLSLSVPGVSLSGSLSTTDSRSKVDLIDMNGDGIVDLVTVTGGDGGTGYVQYTDPLNLVPNGAATNPDGVAIRDSSGVTYSAGMGISIPFHQHGPTSDDKGSISGYPSGDAVGVGGGISISHSSVSRELLDVNGDGLPDEVRIAGGFMWVRLNLGDHFAEYEDKIPVSGGAGAALKGFDKNLSTAMELQLEGDQDDDEVDAGSAARSVFDGLAADTSLQKNTTVTSEQNASISIEEEWGASANTQETTNRTEETWIDVNGDGLPDWVHKTPDEDCGAGMPLGSCFHVRLNLGYAFGDVLTWPVDCWQSLQGAHPLQEALAKKVGDDPLPPPPSGSGSGSLACGGGALAPLVPTNALDAVEASGSLNLGASAGQLFTVTFPIFVATPWIILTNGVDMTPSRVSGAQVSMMDINGDGLPDHVLKGPDGNLLYARINANGGRNLLSRVTRPLGGSIELSYVRTGNTVYMPQSRYVLDTVVVRDGAPADLAAAPGHTFVTSYAYSSGNYDRAERDFLGFSTVTETRQDGSHHFEQFANDAFYDKGLLLSEELRDPSGKLYTYSENRFGYVLDPAPPAPAPAVVALNEIGDLDPSCKRWTPFFLDPTSYCGSYFYPLNSFEKRFYEGQSDKESDYLVHSVETFTYEPTTGNVKHYEDLGAPEDPRDDVVADVIYVSNKDTQNYHQLSLVKELDVTFPNGGNPILLRKRTGDDYSPQGDLLTLSEYIDGNTAAVSSFVYNPNGTLQSWQGPPNTNIVPGYPSGQRFGVTYEYDTTTGTFVTKATDSFNDYSTADYDLGLGALVSTTDISGNTSGRAYDEFGRLSKVWAPGFDENSPTAEMLYQTVPWPARAKTKNALENQDALVTTVFADGLGRVIETKKTVFTATDGLGFAVSGAQLYDVMGRVVSQGQLFFSPDADPLAYVSPQSNYPTTFEYDVLGRTTKTVEPNDPATPDDPTDAITVMAYGVSSLPGLPSPLFSTTVTDADGHIGVSYHDVKGRQVAVEEHIKGQDGAVRTPTTQYLYDPLGQLATITDAAGNKTSLAYDLLGRRTKLTNPDTGATEDTYDAAGNLIQHIDGNHASSPPLTYAYDQTRLMKVVRPHGDPLEYTYGEPEKNGAGRVTSIADEVGTETRTYDALGNVASSTRIIRPLKPGDAQRSFTTQLEWDVYGRLMNLTYPDGEKLSYTYDPGGLVTSAEGVRPATQWSPAADEKYLESLTYDVFGHRVDLKMGNHVETTYAYDPKTLRLSTLTTTSNTTNRRLQASSYTYDAVGNVKTLTNSLGRPTNGHSGTVSYTYEYDDLNRLTHATGSAESRPGVKDEYDSRFEYSDIHNLTHNLQVRTLVKNDGELHIDHPETSNHDWTYTYATGQNAAPHQALTIGPTQLGYDSNGNTLFECRAAPGSGVCGPDGHLRQYAWTDENWLRSVTDEGGGHFTRFLYDASGQRVVKQGLGGDSLTIGTFYSVHGHSHATKHIFVNETRLASKLLPPPEAASQGGTVGGTLPPGCDPSSNQPQKCPIIGGGPVAGGSTQQIRPATYYYHSDHLGSTEWVTDSNGLVHEHLEYYPYGEIWREPKSDDDKGPSSNTPYQFTGKEFDPETGLTYFGARYYDSKMVRWISADPDWIDQGPIGLSIYHYARWSPVRFADPDGRKWQDFLAGLGWGLPQPLKPPGSPPAELPVNEDPDFYLGAGGGQLITSLAEGYQSVQMMLGGGAMMLGGGTLSLSIFGAEVGIPLGAVGAVVSATGAAVGAHAAHHMGAGLNTLSMWSKANREPGSSPEAAQSKGGAPQPRKNLWKLTRENSSRVLRHDKFGSFYKEKSGAYWWTQDNAGHGGSAFKVYKETPTGLEWTSDADQYGNFINNKHKGDVGRYIPWKDLHGN